MKVLTRISVTARPIRLAPLESTVRALVRRRGFTLIEIMVVLVIVGIMLTMFTVSMGGFSEDEEREHARRFEALLDLAADEASIQGRELGLRFYQHGYEFAVREAISDADGNLVWAWRPEQDDNFLRPRELGEDITLDLELDGKEVTLPYEASDRDVYQPQVYILSAGGFEPPFVLRIRPAFSRDGVALSVDTDGAVEWLEDEF